MSDEFITHRELLAEGTSLLDNADFADGARECRLLLQAAGGFDHAGLLGALECSVSDPVADTYRAYIARRLLHEPVYRIIGEREFHGLRFRLSAQTLEPRDDTECLIEAVLERVDDRSRPQKFLDLGTGSGCVAITLLHELPAAQAVATDISKEALETTRKNAVLNAVGNRLETLASDWLNAVDGTFDFIVSNPPYISSDVVDELAPDVRDFDPRAALDGGRDGLDPYRAILSGFASLLNPSGFLALEIGFDQADSVTAMGEEYGWKSVGLRQDLGGNDRVLVFVRA